jgi:Fe2+ or Zn2+ uptake regulation protein
MFNQLQTESIRREWRQLAAQRLGWNFLKLRRVIWRVKKYNNLELTPVKEQVLKFVTEEHQTLKQISRNFQEFSRQWIYEILERLASEGYIEKKPTQKTVGKKKTYETLYRLPQAN